MLMLQTRYEVAPREREKGREFVLFFFFMKYNSLLESCDAIKSQERRFATRETEREENKASYSMAAIHELALYRV